MSGLVETSLTAALAAVACVSWVFSTRRGARAMTDRQLALLAGWAGLRAAGHLLAALPVSPWFSVGAFGAAAVLALGGAVLAVGLVPTPGGPPRLLAEGALIATSLTAVLWAAADGVQVMAPDCYGRLAIAIADIVVLALIVRLAAGAPHLVTDRRQFPAMLLGGGAVLALTVADGLPLLTYRPLPPGAALPPAAAVGGPSWALAAASLGYLLAAVLPWFSPAERARPGPPPSAALRSVPFLLVVAAVLAVAIRSARTAVGPVLVLLIILVIAAMIVLLVVALRENGRLVGALSVSRDSLEALVENTGDVIVRLDARGRVVSANAATERLLGRRPAELLGRPLAELAEPGRRDRVAAAVAGVAGGRATAAQVEFELAAPAGGIADLRLRGMAEGAIGNLHDVTDAVALRRSLERMARYDEMTGLANRAHVVEVVTGWLAHLGPPGSGGPVAVVSGDLNGFKAVNDRFGHPAGDQVLKEIADRLRELVRPLRAECLVGRIGGDEFVVAVRDLDDAGVTALALRLGAATAPSFRVGERTLGLAISVGVATARPGDGVDASTLLHRASLAMFDAKAEGLDEVTRWAPHLEERAQRRVDIAIGLRAALDGALRGQSGGPAEGRPEHCGLTLAYQPLVRLADGVVIGAEALIRVPPQTPDGPFAGLAGLVTPAEIVEVAEDTGVIIELGHWVLVEATRQAAQWRLDGHDVLIGVNMSVRQLAASGFADTVLAAMQAAGLPPDRLFLEITESRLLGESGPALSALERLKAAGVIIAIDDFGTGYSSLSYLRRLPVRAVKLDRALLEGILTDPKARGLVGAVTGMADVLGLMVVAEGLEDLDTIRTVHQLGATIGQGYALSPAVPAAWLARILRHGRLDTGVAAQLVAGEPGTPGEGPLLPGAGGNGTNGHQPGPAVELPDPRSGRISHAETRRGPD